MATFSEIGREAERISYQVSYLERTEKTLEEILTKGEKWSALYVQTGDGTQMELYDVPKEVIQNLVQEYRIKKLATSIEEGKQKIAEMAANVEY